MLLRTELINKLINDNGYKSYLEIGYQWGMNFDNVECEKKLSVDPELKFNADFRGTSDEFFEQNKETFDIVFVDGMHLEEFVYRDVTNSLKVLNKGGVIVIHDCLPVDKLTQYRERTVRNWHGDVWKAIVALAHDGYKMELHEIESGIVLLWNEHKTYEIPEGELSWNWYKHNYKNIF